MAVWGRIHLTYHIADFVAVFFDPSGSFPLDLNGDNIHPTNRRMRDAAASSAIPNGSQKVSENGDGSFITDEAIDSLSVK
ncbi:hypothetical protein Pmar_PMAR009965, partial [Perkinsus marinus ATCC 50983]